jgi:hypothetical protein
MANAGEFPSAPLSLTANGRLAALPSLKPIDRADGGRQQREFSQPIDDVEGAIYLRHSPPAPRGFQHR